MKIKIRNRKYKIRTFLTVLMTLAFSAGAFAYTAPALLSWNLPQATMSSVLSVNGMTPSMQHRVGELMWLDKDGLLVNRENGMWLRGFSNITGYRDVDFNMLGGELGYDRQVAKNLYLGILGQYASYSSDIDLAADGIMTASGMAFGGGLYLIYFTENGWFVDLAGRYIRTMTEATPAGAKPADINRNNIAVSLEGGKETVFNSGFMITPSLGVTYMRLMEGSDNTSNGIYTFDDSDVLRANVNLLLGWRFRTSFGAMQPYLKLGSELLLSNSYAEVTKGRMYEEVEELIVEAALGLDLRVNNRLFIYAEAGYGYGDEMKEANFMAGLRYAFGSNYGNSAVVKKAADVAVTKTEAAKDEAGRQAQKEAITQAPAKEELAVAECEAPRTFVENDLNVSIKESEYTLDLVVAGFATGSYSVPPTALTSIKDTYNRLRAAGMTPQVYVIGHTDSVGSAASNDWLAMQRSRSVTDLLVKAGLPKDVFIISGRGESQPMASNDTADGRKLNRRVEINIR